MNQMTKTNLSRRKRNFVQLMQEINFGRIENFPVKNGEPELTRDTIIEREIKLHGINGARPESTRHNFVLKQEVLALFKYLSRLNNGTIRQLEIKHGLPFLIRIEERAIQ